MTHETPRRRTCCTGTSLALNVYLPAARMSLTVTRPSWAVLNTKKRVPAGPRVCAQ